MTFTDEATGYIRARNLKTKSDATRELLNNVKWVERQCNTKVKQIRLDGGGEYLSAIAKLGSEGVEIHVSAPYTPNENGRAERQNHT